MNTIPSIKVCDRNDIPNGDLVNMEAMPKGLNCKYLECTLSHHNPPKFIAYQWRRKMPEHLISSHVIVVFNGNEKDHSLCRNAPDCDCHNVNEQDKILGYE